MYESKQIKLTNGNTKLPVSYAFNYYLNRKINYKV